MVKRAVSKAVAASFVTKPLNCCILSSEFFQLGPLHCVLAIRCLRSFAVHFVLIMIRALRERQDRGNVGPNPGSTQLFCLALVR